MKIDIPLPCPSCGGERYSASYDAAFSILKKRSWQACKECDFGRDSEDFKKTLCCAWQYFSKQILIETKKLKQIESIP